MAEIPEIFISHTTQDRRDHILARRLANGLKARGVNTWLAPETIPAGEKWQDRLTDAIMNRCSHLLVILSAASIRSEWVLEELRLAQKRCEIDPGFHVLPLMTGEPGDFEGRRFLDQFQHLAFHERFTDQLEEVAKALGLPICVPDFFRTLIAEKTRDFVGREYVFSAVEKFMEDNSKGYFIIQGDPGEGKTALLAEYVQRTGCIAHFNIRSEGITRTRQFVDNICSQLSGRYGIKDTAEASSFEEEGTRLRRMIEETTAQKEKENRLVIAVDALDEAEQTGNSAGTNILSLPPVLPGGVFFIMTTRRLMDEDIPFVVYSPRETLDLMDYGEQGRKDIRTYLERAAGRREMKERLNREGTAADVFIDILAEKSRCNFMYLYYVLPEIEKGAYKNLDLEDLPTGLKGYYEDHWRRMGMTSKPVPRDKISIIYVLAEVRQPVSPSLILDFIKESNPAMDELAIQEVLDCWRQFLYEHRINGERRYSLYHASFRDFLYRKNIVRAAGVSQKGINAMIAKQLWRTMKIE